MSDHERAAISNGIWICRTCHGHIDKDQALFSVELLLLWKKTHEEQNLAELGSAGDRLRMLVVDKELEAFGHLPAFIREIIKDKPDYWEYILSCELLDHYIAPTVRRGRDLELGRITKTRILLQPERFNQWMRSKPAEFLQVGRALSGLIEDLQNSWGPSGTPGDVNEIDHVCRLYGETAKHLLTIAEDATFTAVPEGFEDASKALSEGAFFTLRLLPDLPRFLRSMFAEGKPSGEYKFSLVLDLPEGWADSFSAAIERGQEALAARDYVW
ncbi:hypothetical protein HT585_22225 [Ensifer sp. HO-A22]|uniref:HNH endonuclease n=1 Tax=Ensifer oleiphilus TaxID=2742698 RepID=A0A7Y6Q9L8_9HYPH|nr:hypothetical protein [Ensifer oleiphilus]NVD41589.1 hypothetical protein [Ensifer oleiphilus]